MGSINLKGVTVVSGLTFVSAEGKPLQSVIMDEKESRINNFDKDGNEVVVSECNKLTAI